MKGEETFEELKELEANYKRKLDEKRSAVAYWEFEIRVIQSRIKNMETQKPENNIRWMSTDNAWVYRYEAGKMEFRHVTNTGKSWASSERTLHSITESGYIYVRSTKGVLELQNQNQESLKHVHF